MATTLLILGASGDLTSRLLLPALGQLLLRERDRSITLIGAGSDELSGDEWHARVAAAFAECGASDELTRLEGTHYVQADVTHAPSMHELLAGITGSLVIYFALPPAVTRRCCEVMAASDLPASTVLALE